VADGTKDIYDSIQELDKDIETELLNVRNRTSAWADLSD